MRTELNIFFDEKPVLCQNPVDSEQVEFASFKLSEQVRLLPPMELDGVHIYILDESSKMFTGSFKAFDAFACISECIQKGIQEICFTSGANTGIALTAYANKVGMTTHFFVPYDNIWKLDKRYVCLKLSNIYSVKDARMTKNLCEKFSHETNIPLVPKMEHRRRAAHRRGAFIVSLIEDGLKADWFAQTVCAGFGPIGIYDFLLSQREQGILKSIPRLLAIQQSGNCALAQYLKSRIGSSRVMISKIDEELIEETMYDKHPETYGTFNEMEHVIRQCNGVVVMVTKKEFENAFRTNGQGRQILDHLEQCGIRLATAMRNGTGLEFVQKSGLLAIIGVLKAVEFGFLPKDQKVLCSFSGGATIGTFQQMPADYAIKLSEPYDRSLGKIIESTNQRRRKG